MILNTILVIPVFASVILGQTDESTTADTISNNQTTYTTDAQKPLEDYPQDDNFGNNQNYEDSNPEVVLQSEAGLSIPQSPSNLNQVNKHIPVGLFSQFSPENFLRPIQDKLSKFTEYLSYPYHPNYGGVQFFSPQHLWEKFHEKGHHFLTGPKGSIFGVGGGGADSDYPFAYRQSRNARRKRNFLLNKLNQYRENRSNDFQYNFDYVKVESNNNSYQFPYLLNHSKVGNVVKDFAEFLENQ